MPADALISIRDLRKIYRRGGEEVRAVDGISLDIGRGEYLSIMGPSGSGKSTLFNLVGALDRPTSGEVLIGSVSLPRLSSLELAFFRCRHIGYVFQTYNLIPSLSALENVVLPATFLGLDDNAARTRAHEVLGYVGLDRRSDHRPHELSGGQQQRVAIARALVNRPTILLADEPTANLDLETGRQIIDLFRQLVRDFGVTVISATHDHKMLAVSDRIVWIKNGKIDRVKTAAEMRIGVGAIG